MRSIVTLLLLAPALMFAVSLQPMTVLPVEGKVLSLEGKILPSSPQPGSGPSREARALVGTIDTIGGTTYDWWANGPRLSAIVNSPTYGVHAVWMYCPDLTGQDFPNRNMRYNYYEYASRTWIYADPGDFMAGGVNVFPKRAGFGNIDADPTSGVAVIGGHVAVGADIMPWLARDAAPGAGLWDYADSMGLGVCQWPPISVGQDGQINIFAITAAYDLIYGSIAPGNWPNWATPVTGFVPSPGFPTHNIAASKVSSKVALAWDVQGAVGSGPEHGYVDFTTDGGATWDGPTLLDPPTAFGGDTLTSYHITSMFPWYDRQDRFHVVANLAPVTLDSIRGYPSQVWHYCPDNTPQWSLIHLATADSFASGVSLGYNAAFACRPNIGQDNDGNLFVVWEQFDPLNYEPATMDLRADIFASGSNDNGVSWGAALKLTDAGSYSMRFPSVIDLAVAGDPDTMFVIYEIDSIAGFYVSTTNSPEGPATQNPAVVQKIPVDLVIPPGVAEQPGATPVRLDVVAKPNPFGRDTRLSYAVPHRGNVSLTIFDAAGRTVRTLASGRSEPGRFSAVWDGRSQSGALVPNGVYMYRYALDGKRMAGKLTLIR